MGSRNRQAYVRPAAQSAASVSFPLGYEILPRETVIAREAAQRVLSVHRQSRLAKAIRHGDTISVIRYATVCPRCGAEAPAVCGPLRARTPDEIGAWASGQASLFGEEPEQLVFRAPGSGPELYCCPGCGGVFPAGGKARAVLSRRRRKISLVLPLEPTDRMCLTWTRVRVLKARELSETLTFNLRSGHTYLSLEGDGRRYAVRDITGAHLAGLTADPVVDLFLNCKPVARNWKRIMQGYWGGRLPFAPGETTLERCVLLVRFIGYDREFYRSVPCCAGENEIEKSFARAAARLHFARHVPAVFASSALPRIKSVKRLIYTRPAWLFYQRELEQLWQLLQKPDLLCRLLTSERVGVFELLTLLRKYPGTLSFLRDYAAVRGTERLFRLLSDPHGEWQHYAIKYAAMSGVFRAAEREKWIGRRLLPDDLYSNTGAPFSVPVHAETFAFLPEDCVVRGFRFVRLRSSYEFQQAGRDLANCLTEWSIFCSLSRTPVYGVRKGDRYVAAIELDSKTVVQAYAARNMSIGSDPSLASAYLEWMDRYGLKE